MALEIASRCDRRKGVGVGDVSDARATTRVVGSFFFGKVVKGSLR